MPRGNVYFVTLPPPPGGQGREQSGYRPVVVISSDQSASANPMALVVPLTSKLGALRFPHSVRIQPSSQNGLSQTSVAMVFQLLAMDKTRLRQPAGSLESDYLVEIENELRSILELG